METELTKILNIEVPIIGGAMYPCSNPELVAAISEAGAIGIVQPLALTYVWGHDFREGLKKIKSLTSKPFGMNVLLEKSSRTYEKRMRDWVEIALEEGCRFFITALGNPKEIVQVAKAAGGYVFHDVTERKWALKAIENGVDGLIGVNNRAGGHAGTQSPDDLFAQLKGLKLPLVCAGGIGDEKDFRRALEIGYAGVQIGTRFIATKECRAHEDYKQAIVAARESDIVLTERVTGIPLSVIQTPYVKQIGTKASALARYLLRHRKTKEWMRLFYNLRALFNMKRSALRGLSTKDYWQAGKSVEHIHKIESVKDIVGTFRGQGGQVPG
ncbi:MAG: 2-nitropropane dioxygenase [Deltaproteobacteria bacterium CG11_big_fil_rev_8_21_14_0_20_45_16]|nr:MAG: 2-nitropropane dioxygenase [Deltaproteobacteria bacterium CG11_big_fil_rev_8_21_14_0_20_45_16]